MVFARLYFGGTLRHICVRDRTLSSLLRIRDPAVPAQVFHYFVNQAFEFAIQLSLAITLVRSSNGIYNPNERAISFANHA